MPKLSFPNNSVKAYDSIIKKLQGVLSAINSDLIKRPGMKTDVKNTLDAFSGFLANPVSGPKGNKLVKVNWPTISNKAYSSDITKYRSDLLMVLTWAFERTNYIAPFNENVNYFKTFAGLAANVIVTTFALVDGLDSLNDNAGTARAAQGNGQNSGVVVLSLDSAKAIQNGNAIKVAQTTAANATIGANTANAGTHAPSIKDVFVYYVDIPNAALVSQTSMNVSVGGVTITSANNTVAYPGGDWVPVIAAEAGNAAAWAAATPGIIGHSLRMSQNSPYGAEGTFDAVIKTTPDQAYFSYVYDDCIESQYLNAFPLHVKYNIPFDISFTLDFLGKSGRMSESMLQDMFASGLARFVCDSTFNDSSADTTDTDAARAGALASLMQNHDGIVSRGLVRDESHKNVIWANNSHSPRLAQHFQDNGFRIMRSTIPGYNYAKFGIGKGRAKKINSHPSTNVMTYDGNFKAEVDRAILGSLWRSKHMHGISFSGNDTNPTELEKELARVRAEIDAGTALGLTYGMVWTRAKGFTVPGSIVFP